MSIIKILEAMHDEGLLELEGQSLDRAFEYIRPSKEAKDIGLRVRLRVLASAGWIQVPGDTELPPNTPVAQTENDPPPLPDPPPPSEI